MRTLRSTWLAVLMVVLVVTALAPAEDGGWKLPSLNPFKSDKPAKKRGSASLSDSSESFFHMPKVSLPFTQKSTPPRRPAPKGPSTLERVSSGTKNFFSKTYDVLTPWDNDAPAKPSSQMRSPRKEETSWFPWFSQPEKDEVKTVNEFIALPRVQP